MARLRSPGYPNFPLPHVIELANKIHRSDRQHPVAREVAAQHMGFSGLTGASDRALSALMHYDLAEKVGKGEIRITDLALRIIHPDSGEERRAALLQAAFSPDLFRELRNRYSGAPPSLGSLTSYLSRENFAPAAIPSAARAYLETCDFLLREGAYEGDSFGGEEGSESLPTPPSKPETQVLQAPLVQASPVLKAVVSAAAYSNPGQRPDVFTIGADGEVVVSLPSVLTQDMYDDLKDWLELIARKAKRKVVPPPAAAGPAQDAHDEDEI